MTWLKIGCAKSKKRKIFSSPIRSLNTTRMSRPSFRRRVVVTGCGMVTPLGRNAEQTFSRACQGDSGVDFICSFDTRGLPCRIGGEVKNPWWDESESAKLGRLEKFAARGVKMMVTATREAAQQAGLDKIAERESIGVSLGSHGENPSVDEILFVLSFYKGDGQWNLQRLMQ